MRRLILASAAALLLASGCGAPRYRLHGTVRHQGKPLAGGTIIFLGEDNQTYPARIRPDGTYEAAAVPRGHIRVAVQADVARPTPRTQPSGKANDALAKGEAKADDAAKQARRPSAPPAPAAPALPPHYADPNSSGLAFDLQGPDQEYSVDLK
jgi:hypothetical protein